MPTLDEPGYKTVSGSPFGVCGAKGMKPANSRTSQDAFKRTRDHSAVLATLEKVDQSVICMDIEDHTRFARATFVAEKATIERLGMAAKAQALGQAADGAGVDP